MPSSMRAAAGIALVAVVALGVLAYTALQSSIGGPSRTPSNTMPTAPPTAVATPAWTRTMSSTMFGYDAQYPDGWRVALGTTQGSASELALGEHAAPPRFWDHITPTQGGAVASGLFATSTVIPVGMAEDAWIDAYQAPQVQAEGRACIPQRSTWDTITIDGHEGGIYSGCGYAESMVFVGRRAYVFSYINMTANSGPGGTADRSFLETFLGTVTLRPPETAISTDGWSSYHSDRYGFAIGYGKGWTVTPADREWSLATDRSDWLSPAAERFYNPELVTPEGAGLLVTAWKVPWAGDVDAFLDAYLPTGERRECDRLEPAVTVSAGGDSALPARLVHFCEDVQVLIDGEKDTYVIAAWRSSAESWLHAYLSTFRVDAAGP
ncbi:MAG TPA: hypothetical protein VNL94_06270 [Candidatus Binatia bacterium]|nr:hypothetical protein [Candidatus Binatia bacterium]